MTLCQRIKNNLYVGKKHIATDKKTLCGMPLGTYRWSVMHDETPDKFVCNKCLLEYAKR